MDPLLGGFIDVLLLILQTLWVLILASVIISWVGADPNNAIVRMIRQTTEPLYKPFRGISRALPGPFDWSPMILMLIIFFLQSVLKRF